MDSTSVDEPVHRDEQQQQIQRIKPNDNVVVNRNSNKRSDALKVCRGNLVSKGGEKLNLNTFREAASHESFLETLFELFDEDGDGLIDQDDFIMSFHQQLKDEKGKQFCEVLETATFAIAHEQLIRLPIFLSIFSTKRLLDKLFIVMDKDGDNLVSINEAMDFIAKLTIAQTPTSLTKENLDYLKDLFINHCNENHEITLENFRKIIKSKNVFFTERVFHIFDRDGSGTVSLQEFLDAVGKFSGQSMDNKIKFLFDIYDQDGDGRVQMRELRQVIKACMDENGMAFSEEQLDDLTTALFEDADPQNTGAITVEALKAQLEKHEGMVENLSYSIEKWLVPPRPEVKTFAQEVKASVPHQLSWGYMKNNHVFLVFFLAFIALNIALFISRMWQYRASNEWVMVARGCGQCLNFTCMFILVLMLRKSITWLRSRGVSAVLPLDEHIYLHKFTGYLIFIYSFGHTIAHIGNLVVEGKAKDDDDDVLEYVIENLFTDKRGVGWVYGTAYPTGVALLVILVVMVVCSQNFVRKGGKFEVFYWTHRLYIAFFILCFIHGPRFWHWFIVPCIIFIIEMAIRFRQRRTGYGRTHITEAVLLPSKVTHLVIKRPPNFHFRAGDYVFIKIPSIAKYEWHPFTLSSAPEQSDVVWLHIRGVGEWTNQLYGHINKQFQAIMAAQNPPAIEQATPKQSIFARGSRYLKRKTTLQINGENGDTLGLSSNPQGYQPMGSPLTTSTESIEIDTKTSNQLKLPDKQKVIPVKSLPIFEKNVIADEHKGLARSRSHRIDSTGSYSPIPGSSTVCVRTRTRGQSFKHMRRKPKVLPMPGLSTAIIHEEDGETSEGVLDTVVISAEPSAQLTTVTTNDDELETVTLHIPAKSDNEVELRERVPTLATAGSRTSFVCYDPASEAKPLEVIIDGPYGAPSSHIFRAEHAVLVGTGIGVTPFASILQSIMRRYWEARLGCPKCHYTWTNKLPESYLNLRKVDFFWINRDQKSFEWFVNLLSELEIEQAEQGGAMERFLDMHMYITTALQKTDMKAVGLHLALDLLHEKEKRDMITGLKTRTHPGRPNWNKVFRQIANQKKGRVTVFFCGPPQLARSLKLKCDEFGFIFKKEVF